MKSISSLVRWIVLVFSLCLLLMDAHAQVTITVKKIPLNSPPGDSIFISGSFNEWAVRDFKMQLLKQPDGSYTITIPKAPAYFEYKFTRGSWYKVEGDQHGNNIPNRIFSQNTSHEIEAVIETWMDLQSIKIVVERLPVNTPAEAPIYLTGAFNHWNPADADYKLERLANGSYQYFLLHRDSIAFKFTRGTLQSMETDAAGNAIAPHNLALRATDKRTLVYQIDGWEDFSNNAGYSVRDLLIVAFVLAVFAIAGLFFIRNNKQENNVMVIILLAIALAIATRILLLHPYFYYKVPKLILFPLLLLFALSPLLNLYTKNLVHHYKQPGAREYLIMQIPLAILIVGMLPLLIAENSYVVSSLLNHDLDVNFEILAGIAVLYNSFYLLETFKVLHRSQKVGGLGTLQWTYHNYLSVLLWIGVFITFVLVVTLLSSIGVANIVNLDEEIVVNVGIHTIWIGLCLYPFTIVWFIMVRPEIFSLNAEIEKTKSKEALGALKTKLDDLMETKKPYLNPDLSLPELAVMLQTNTHTLSKMINEEGPSNYNDFINHYRIKEFKRRVENGEHKVKTIIGIALEVGFNSKTTFNRTFKKLNGSTPRDYLNTLKIVY
jgi:AraC-like DNA-binding protein